MIQPEIDISRAVIRRPLCVSDAPHEKNSKEQFINRIHKIKEKSQEVITAKWWKKKILSTFPFIGIFGQYSLREDLVGDVASGLTVGIMNIPQGMAYAFLASLGPVYGLYVSFFPIIVYFFFGTSKHIAIGTASIPSLLIGSIVERDLAERFQPPINTTSTSLEDSEMQYKIQIAVAMTLMAGIFQIIMSFLRLGGVTVLLSPALVSGFTTGAAVHVLTSQVKFLFDIRIPRHSGSLNIIYTYIDIIKKIPETNICAIIISIICIVILTIFKEVINPKFKAKLRMPFPIELLLVIIATLASHYGGLPSKYSVTTVGKIPAGFSTPTLPKASFIPHLIADAFTLSVISFTITLSLAKIFAQRHDYNVDPNQELLALGWSNTISSFFNCYACCASLSRSSVQESVGGKTQLAGLFSCALILIVLLAAGPLFQPLPKLVWIVAFVGVVILDVDIGLGLGVMFSLLTVAFRSHYSKVRILGVVPGSELYTDFNDTKTVEELPGLKILKLENPLNHISSQPFKSRVYHLSGINPEKKKKEVLRKPTASTTDDKQDSITAELAENGLSEADALHRNSLKTIIFDCSAIAHMDSAGLHCLLNLMNDYKAVDITVLLACCTSPTRNMLRTVESLWDDWRHLVFNTVHDAVLFHYYGRETEKLEVHVRSSNTNV
ncbi:DgyrCDS5053 [Dimorphilus gyrociliatus]|uniref:DgyrCDS5053 n=1 Tax=Dimorphilus gyrociliatus TaxID=2664684 RepID=A0A7I8VIM1_9ANNE|nr:DgyrCDS5053 [Dimorphilus gyrociliatus]